MVAGVLVHRHHVGLADDEVAARRQLGRCGGMRLRRRPRGRAKRRRPRARRAAAAAEQPAARAMAMCVMTILPGRPSRPLMRLRFRQGYASARRGQCAVQREGRAHCGAPSSASPAYRSRTCVVGALSVPETRRSDIAMRGRRSRSAGGTLWRVDKGGPRRDIRLAAPRLRPGRTGRMGMIRLILAALALWAALPRRRRRTIRTA